MLSDCQTTRASDIDTRLQPVERCLESIQEALLKSDSAPSIVERVNLSSTKSYLHKLAKAHVNRNSLGSSSYTQADIEFSDFFLEAFTSKALFQEMDDLRKAEGGGMTEGDLATLADAIRGFGLSIPESDRVLFRESIDSSD